MRIAGIQAHRGINLHECVVDRGAVRFRVPERVQPKKNNISFGLIEDEETKKSLSGTENQIKFVEACPFFTVKGKGEKPSISVDKELEEISSVSWEALEKIAIRTDLREERHFRNFYKFITANILDEKNANKFDELTKNTINELKRRIGG